VSSCVFTNIPISGKAEPNYKEGKRGSFAKSIICGNINHQGLSEIWNSIPYKKFRHTFEAKQESIKEDIDLAIDAVRFQVSKKGEMEAWGDPQVEGLPDQCRNCYRMLGV